MSEHTIGALYGLRAPRGYKPPIAKEYNQKVGPDPILLYGVEFEIENTVGSDGDPEMHCVPGIVWKEDGSLRNRGLEFITKPMDFTVLEYTTQKFFDHNDWGDKNYSERCSIHVHANCQDLTPTQLGMVLMLYQGFEKLLYAFVGENRDKNIFCVPWSETMMTYNIVNKIKLNAPRIIRNWQKYLGLNLYRLQDLGTIEFRHFPGSYDVKKIITWYEIIGSMFALARNINPSELESLMVGLNTTSAYDSILERVFGANADHLRVPEYQRLLEEGILNLKYMMLDKDEKEPADPFAEFRAAQNIVPPPQDPRVRQAQNAVIQQQRDQMEQAARNIEREPQVYLDPEPFRNWNTFIPANPEVQR